MTMSNNDSKKKLKREQDDSSNDNISNPNSDLENNLSKRQKIKTDPDEGLSIYAHDNSNDNPNNQAFNPEVIDSSSSRSSSSSLSDSDLNENMGNNNNNIENNIGENEEIPTHEDKNNDEFPDSDSDSEFNSDDDISEFQFDELDKNENEIDLNLYDKNCQIPPLNEIKVTKKLCSQIRKFLKTEGHVSFLDLFLPSGPTSDDIIILTKLLGFKPSKAKKNLSSVSSTSSSSLSDPLHLSIYFLREAINRVLKTRTKLLDFHTIENVCDSLKKSKNILVLTGAGISTSLGIPDFRSSQGFYSKMRNLGLDDPQDVFSLELFKRDPSIFYSIAYMILPPEDSFTPLHGFIKLLQDKGKLLRNYTQNIDNLEANAGVQYDKLVQCHGSFATASCITCKYKIPGETLYPNLREKKIAYCPFCEGERKNLIRKFEKMEDDDNFYYSSKFENIKSFGVMKPDITFFGENLPDRYHNTIKEDVRKCDLLICIGTSLKVAPVSEIVNKIPNEIPQILINRDPINHCEFDVELLGYCDQVITWLCGDKLNWKINHKDFERILHSGLELNVLDEEFGRYKITDANERLQISLKKLEEEKLRKNQEDGAEVEKEENEHKEGEEIKDADTGIPETVKIST